MNIQLISILKNKIFLFIATGLVLLTIGTVVVTIHFSNLSEPEQIGVSGNDGKDTDETPTPGSQTTDPTQPTPSPTPANTSASTPGSTNSSPAPTAPVPAAQTPSDPTPTPPVTCELPKYPNPSCTGVPTGTVLTTINGDYTANTPGEVVNAKRITGNLYIGAEGITVTNSQIDGTIYNNQALDHFSFTVTDTTIGPETGCIGQPGINDSRYTARRVEVRGHDDGFRVGTPGDVAIYDSYAKLCYLTPDVAPPDGSHSDGVQAYCPGGICSGLIVDHNTFDSRGIIATFMLNLAYDQLRNVTATNNMLAGGPYVLVAKWFGGPNYVISNNRIVDNSWIYAPVSGEGTCANQTWSGNTIVTIDDSYAITSTVRTQDCQY